MGAKYTEHKTRVEVIELIWRLTASSVATADDEKLAQILEALNDSLDRPLGLCNFRIDERVNESTSQRVDE